VFLSVLNNRQKLAFLSLADAVIRADQHLAPQEQAMLAAMRAEMNLSDSTPVPAMDIPTAGKAFDCRRSRVAAMIELVGLCLADDEVAPEEEVVLSSIRDALGLTAAEALAQRDWVLRQMALVHEANCMMMEEA